MERVAFLLEGTGTRLRCLLNPETLVTRRLAGVRPRRSLSGPLTGAGLADNPLLYTGGGTTELELDLLFDVTLAGSSMTTEDVRVLTAPLWELAENSAASGGFARPPAVRFLWGKGWNIPGVITAVAERLESFTAQGLPRRSWLRMKFVRVQESSARPRPNPPPQLSALPTPSTPVPLNRLTVLELRGAAGPRPDRPSSTGERLDEIAYQYYGDPAYWRILAAFNDLADPMHVPPGFALRIPALDAL